MKNFLKRCVKKTGLPPGTPIYIGNKKAALVKIL